MNHKKLQIENDLQSQGYKYICGIDESGVGAFAGGFTVGAVIIDLSKPYIEGVDDSKKLSKKKKRELEPLIKKNIIDYNIVYVSAEEINYAYEKAERKPGSFRKLHLNAMRQAILNLGIKPDFIIVDGKYEVPNIDIPQKSFVKGDQKSYTIASASIMARTYRERIMEELSTKYEGYSHWKNTYGYCSTQEIVALNKLRTTPEHRICFVQNVFNHKSGKIIEVDGKFKMKECPRKGIKCPCDYIEHAKNYGLQLECPDGRLR